MPPSSTKRIPNPVKRRPALLLSLALIAGILLARPLHEALPHWTLIFGVIVATGMMAFATMRRVQHGTRTVLLLVSTAIFGFAYACWSMSPEVGDVTELHGGSAALIDLDAVVVQGTPTVPLQAETGAESAQANPLPFVFQESQGSPSIVVEARRLNPSSTPAGGMLKVYLPEGSSFKAGQHLRLRGRLARPPTSRNQGELDLRQLYADRGIRGSLYISDQAHIESLDDTERFNLPYLSESVRQWTLEQVGPFLSQRSRSLFAALVLGDRESLPREMRNAFVRTGTVHILVVSGLHVAILALVLNFFLGWLGLSGRTRALIIGSIAIVYLVITGMQIATLRAVSLVVLYAIAQWYGRRADFLNILAASAIIVLLRQPTDLFSAGFILSFLSVLGLSQLVPMLTAQRRRDDDPPLESSTPAAIGRWVGVSLGTSAIALVVTGPIVAHLWRMATPAALLTNLFATIPVTLALGVSLLLPLTFIPGVDYLVGTTLEFSLRGLDAIVDAAAGSEASSSIGFLSVAPPPLWWLLVFYLALLGVGAAHRIPRGKRFALPLLLLVVCVLPFAAPSRSDSGLSVLDVQQGACSVLTSAKGHCVMIDCGSQMRPHVGEWTVAPWLLEHGVRQVDALVLTHADADHINGIASLMEQVAVSRIYTSDAFRDTDQGAEVLEWLYFRGVRVETLSRGDRLIIDDIEINVLWPDLSFAKNATTSTTPINRASLVLRAEMPGLSALFYGDAEDGATVALKDGLQDTDILIAPHHGSQFDQVAMLLEQAKPKFVTVSARDGFADHEMLAVYATKSGVLETWSLGGIQIEPAPNSGELRISSYLADESR